ncbi:MAG: FAD-binding protein [Rhodospirillaceae bacterium]|jgi:electron transfer flavoprotein alpha subunit|nr:FAD-binding protein [Rhodospirillaceae bacterium]
MSALVIAEHNNITLEPTTLNTITAAKQLDEDIHILIAGHMIYQIADIATKIDSVTKVLLADNIIYAHGLAEPLSSLITEIGHNYHAILASATTHSKNVLPRVAALFDVAQISDVSNIISNDTFIRQIYTGKALEILKSKDNIKIITVRSSSFKEAKNTGGHAIIETVSNKNYSLCSSFLSRQINKSRRPELITSKIIISGGRGIGSIENFKLLEVVADKLGAAVGATRAAVDSGFATTDMQIGQSGKIVSPELYIAVAISGAPQHIAGISDSKIIVAINKDKDAPIISIADYFIVGDLYQILPELVTELNK